MDMVNVVRAKITAIVWRRKIRRRLKATMSHTYPRRRQGGPDVHRRDDQWNIGTPREGAPPRAVRQRAQTMRPQSAHGARPRDPATWQALPWQQVSLRVRICINQRGQMELNLSEKKLKDIPQEAFNFTRLQALRLSKNRLQLIPSAIAQLRRLETLDCRQNLLGQVPDTIGHCQALCEVDLSHNKLRMLPPQIGLLKQLQVLRLSHNMFETLPSEIGLLENIRILEVQSNKLWSVPFTMDVLQKLRAINMAANRIDIFPLQLCSIKSLEIINARDNLIKSLPDDIDQLRLLKDLNLQHNQLDAFPPILLLVKSLVSLNLSANRIRNLPNDLAKLNRLKVLQLERNKLDSVDLKADSIEFLNIGQNQIRHCALLHTKSLRHLDLTSNQLENLPLGVCNVLTLECLKLANNKIQYISRDIGLLKNLTHLDLGNNRISQLPQVVNDLVKLEYFNVKGNKITNRPLNLDNEGMRILIDEYMTEKGSESSKRYYNSESGTPRMVSSLSTPNLARFNGRHNDDRYHDNVNNGPNRYNYRNKSNDDLLADDNWTLVANDDVEEGSFVANGDIRGGGHVPMRTPQMKRVRNPYKVPVATDFSLLGVCSQLETLLNQQLLKRAKSASTLYGDMNADQNQAPVHEYEAQQAREHDPPCYDQDGNLIRLKPDRFQVGSRGGLYSSSYDSNIQLYIPVNALDDTVDILLQVEKIDQEALQTAKSHNKVIDNILSVGDIVHVWLNRNITFNHQVSLTIPAPAPVEGEAYLHLLTFKEDNTCTPTSVSYKLRNGYITLQTSNFNGGKGAVLTSTKCKYKACKSAEFLLKKFYV